MIYYIVVLEHVQQFQVIDVKMEYQCVTKPHSIKVVNQPDKFIFQISDHAEGE